MLNSDTQAKKAGAILFEKAERRLKALLAEHGVADPGELEPALRSRLFQRAFVETAAANFPRANLELLKHGLRSSTHSGFLLAVARTRASCRGQLDAFEMTRGIQAAMVLAGFGLPVAPFDLEAKRILAKPSNDIDTVQALFSVDERAYVGYSTWDAPFYLLLTDCVRSLRQLVHGHPRLSEVRELFARSNRSLPPDPGLPFTSEMAIFGRQAGDTISTVALLDPHPAGGSVMLYAGWQVDGEPFGAPNEGYVPVPGELLKAVVNEPKVAYSFWLTPGVIPIH
jgi:hypothetical protein